MSRRITETFARRGVVVVGMGADGWVGLAEEARGALRSAGTVVASPRQLEQLPGWLGVQRVEWRSPHREDIQHLIEEYAGSGVVVLASGDPLVYGIGRTLVQELGVDRLLFLPAVSSVALACARLGWSTEDVTVVNAAGRGLEALASRLAADARLLVLSAGRDTPASVARRLVEQGYGASELVVLGDLGAPKEARWEGRAEGWSTSITSGLNVIAVHCRRAFPTQRPARARTTPALPRLAPGTASTMITAMLMSQLDPAPGELLWEVGGTGACSQRWFAHERCRAELLTAQSAAAAAKHLADPDRATLVPVVERAAKTRPVPRPVPDAVLLVGATATHDLVSALQRLLPPEGRLVATALSLDETAVLARHHREFGGELLRIALTGAATDDSATRWVGGPELVLWRLVTSTT